LYSILRYIVGIVVDQIVYDCTDFVGKHPGGSHIVKEFGGHDCTWQVCILSIPLVKTLKRPDCKVVDLPHQVDIRSVHASDAGW